jgi:hypothetical protein
MPRLQRATPADVARFVMWQCFALPFRDGAASAATAALREMRE